MNILAAMTKGDRTITFTYLNSAMMTEDARWYAALLVAENPATLHGAKRVDVGFNLGNCVIISAAGCQRIVSPVTIKPHDVRIVLARLGWSWTIVDVGDNPGEHQLQKPLEWSALQMAAVLR